VLIFLHRKLIDIDNPIELLYKYGIKFCNNSSEIEKPDIILMDIQLSGIETAAMNQVAFNRITDAFCVVYSESGHNSTPLMGVVLRL
jgi:hypothetical protein